MDWRKSLYIETHAFTNHSPTFMISNVLEFGIIESKNACAIMERFVLAVGEKSSDTLIFKHSC